MTKKHIQVTRTHRLAVLLAWYGSDEQITPWEYEWVENGPSSCSDYPRFDRLAQLVADTEQGRN